MTDWIENSAPSRRDWWKRGIKKPRDLRGMYFTEFCNLASGARIVVLPTCGWEHAPGRYEAWWLPPGGRAVTLGLHPASYAFQGEADWMAAFLATASRVRGWLEVPAREW